MTSTNITNSTNNSSIYLPISQQIYGGILNNSWPANTSTWTQSNLIFDENGSKIVSQISKMQMFIMKYEALINGVIYKELVEKLNALLCKLNCVWGFSSFVGYSSIPWTTTTTTTTSIQPSTYIYQSNNQYIIDGSSWAILNNSTTAPIASITYSY